MGMSAQPKADPDFDDQFCLGQDKIEEPGKTIAARLDTFAVRPRREAEVSKFGIH